MKARENSLNSLNCPDRLAFHEPLWRQKFIAYARSRHASRSKGIVHYEEAIAGLSRCSVCPSARAVVCWSESMPYCRCDRLIITYTCCPVTRGIMRGDGLRKVGIAGEKLRKRNPLTQKNSQEAKAYWWHPGGTFPDPANPLHPLPVSGITPARKTLAVQLGIPLKPGTDPDVFLLERIPDQKP